MTELGINVTLIPINGVPDHPDPNNPLINPRTDLAHAPYHLGAFNALFSDGHVLTLKHGSSKPAMWSIQPD